MSVAILFKGRPGQIPHVLATYLSTLGYSPVCVDAAKGAHEIATSLADSINKLSTIHMPYEQALCIARVVLGLHDPLAMNRDAYKRALGCHDIVIVYNLDSYSIVKDLPCRTIKVCIEDDVQISDVESDHVFTSLAKDPTIVVPIIANIISGLWT